jgi:hypothetical protein
VSKIKSLAEKWVFIKINGMSVSWSYIFIKKEILLPFSHSASNVLKEKNEVLILFSFPLTFHLTLKQLTVADGDEKDRNHNSFFIYNNN